MAKMTKEQIISLNNLCSNDWKLDVQYYIFHNEKTLVKQINIDNENYLEFAIRYNYKNQILLHISKFYHKKDENFASTSGLGKSIILNETSSKRKNVNNLIKFTKNLTDEKLLDINNNTSVSQGSGLIFESEDF